MNLFGLTIGRTKNIIANEAGNSILSRAHLLERLGKTFDGNRDLYQVLGYEKEPTYADYYNRFDRQDIAKRIITAFPDAIWKKQPTIRKEEKDDKSQFEQDFAKFAKHTKLFQKINKADHLAGIGRYSIIVIGARDGKRMDQPLKKISGPDDILYFTPYSEAQASIHKWEEDITNPRYGKPIMYKVRTGGYTSVYVRQIEYSQSSTFPAKDFYVHHSRVIHIAEDTLENDIFGIPRLRPVLNRLDDLEKVVGGSAEIFWLNGRGGLHVNAAKETNLDKDTKEQVTKGVSDYLNKMKRFLTTKGLEITPLQFEVASPMEHFSTILDLIASATGIPKRILLGSERGELASSQDESNWESRVDERRINYCEPFILRPLISRLMEIGAIEMVDDEEYFVVWPELVSLSESNRADVSVKKAQAIAFYANSPSAPMIVDPEQFVKEVLGLEHKGMDLDELMAKEQEREERDMEQMQAGANTDPNNMKNLDQGGNL